MLGTLLTVVLLVVAVAVLLYQGIAIVFAYQMPRLPIEPTSVATSRDSVMVVIAARNEEDDIGDCLAALRRSNYPNLSVTVVDGGSTDRTREIVRERFPEVRLIEEPPLPREWTGKSFACSLGANAATADWILFLDADVRLSPGAIGTAVNRAKQDHADLLSVALRLEMVGLWEKVVLPFYVQMVLTYFRTPRVNSDHSGAAMANGQFLLVSRTAYIAVGGHAAIRSEVIEDIALARLFRRAARRLRFVWAPDFGATRMYRNPREMREGILKLVADNRFSLGRQIGFLAGLVGFFLLPLVLLPVGVLEDSLLLSGVGLFLWVALFGKHVAFSRAVGGSAVSGLLYPLATAYYIDLIATSIRRGLRHEPVVWKGRRYPTNPT